MDEEGGLNENQSIRNYIYVLTKREILNHFRLKYHSQVILTEEIRQFDMADKHKIQELDYHELRETVQQVIDCMPPRRRDIYCMSRLKSIPNKEIAQQLGISIRTVEKNTWSCPSDFPQTAGRFPVYLGLSGIQILMGYNDKA